MATSTTSRLPPPSPRHSSSNNLQQQQSRVSAIGKGSSPRHSSSSSSISTMTNSKRLSDKALGPLTPSSNGSSTSTSTSGILKTPTRQGSRRRYGTPPKRSATLSPTARTPSSGGVRSMKKSPSTNANRLSSSEIRRATLLSTPNLDSKTSLDGTDTTLEDSNDLQEILKMTSPTKKSKMLGSKDVDDEEEQEDTRVFEVTEFHECIYAQDWTHLEKALKKFNGKYYQRLREQAEKKREQRILALQQKQQDSGGTMGDSGSTESGPQSNATPPLFSTQGGLRVLRMIPQSISSLGLVGSNTDSPDKEVPVSPLLKVDDEGRTPLHLAFLYECPEAILLELLNQERLAARALDNFGQLPLHLAMFHRQHEHVLEQILKAYPNALKTKDCQKRTPIGFAVEMARKAQEETPTKKEYIEDPAKPFHWGIPVSDKEMGWQCDQMKIWGRLEFLLKYLMRRKRSIIPSEHGLLVEALEAGAPPKVINQLVSTTDKYLMGDDDFAGSALELCVERQYCLDTLEYLVNHCREGTTVIVDYTEKALVTHYRRGCQAPAPDMPAFAKEIMDWFKSHPTRSEDRDDVDAAGSEANNRDIKKGFLAGASKQCREWWEILRYILFIASYGKNFSRKEKNIKDGNMLHAALTLPTTPPSLVQLLLVIFPEAIRDLCPTYKALPVHLACTRWRYDILRNDKDLSLEKVLKQVLKSDKDQLVRRYRGRLPLHMALSIGQSWSVAKPFVALDPITLGMRDPHTKLFPFQLAAMPINSKNLSLMLRNRYTPTEWRLTSASDKKLEFAKVREQQDRRQIGTIYELLRRYPDAIAGKHKVRNSIKVPKEIKGAGPISSHYLSMVYRRGETEWKLNPVTVKPLRDSIVNGKIFPSLSAWFGQLREIIWKTTPGEIPRTDEFLLHAALYNPDTPPVIIELLLALWPKAAMVPLPGRNIYPLHIAAGTAMYHPQPFEIVYSKSRLELTLQAYKGAVRLTFHGQLPIHISLSRGKTWKEVKCLVQQDKTTLFAEDPITGLTPLGLMASFKITSPNNMLRYSSLVEKQTRNMNMQELTAQERAKILGEIKQTLDLDILSTIYELLRQEPAILSFTRRKNITGQVRHVLTSASSLSTTDEMGGSGTGFQVDTTGMVSVWDKHLRYSQASTPAAGPKRSLSSYLERGVPGLGGGSSHIPMLISPMAPSGAGIRRGVMPGRDSSMRSLISANSGPGLFDDYKKPIYDDDAMSGMGASAGSSLNLSNHNSHNNASGTPGSTSSMRRMRSGTKNRNRLPKLPDLGTDSLH